MLGNSLICHSFAIVNFSCIESSEFSSTRFFKFTRTVLFLMYSKVDSFLSNTTCYWGSEFPVIIFKTNTTKPV